MKKKEEDEEKIRVTFVLASIHLEHSRLLNSRFLPHENDRAINGGRKQ